MKKVTFTSVLLGTAALLAMPMSMHAQDYDDLYYSPSKAAKEQKAKEEARAKAIAAERAAREYKPADTYTTTPSKPLNMDVDAYNRRTAEDAPAIAKAEDGGDFSYTRRIERYHNPDVVSSSDDEELKQYYYSTPSQSDVNVYVINNIDPYCWNSFWPTYSWNNPYYWNSWYNPFWPSFRFSFGFNPWFDISWGWGNPWYGPSWGWGNPWYPGWGPVWGPSWGPGWGYYPPANRPGKPNWAVNNPGTSRPRRPNAYQGMNNSHNAFDQNRPGAMGRPTSRPGNSSNSGYRPAGSNNGNNNGYVPSDNNSRRGTGNSRYGSSSSSPRNDNSGYNNSTPRRSNSNNSYNNYNNSNRGSYNSGSSYGSGRGSSYGGGSRGGGASQGRRR